MKFLPVAALLAVLSSSVTVSAASVEGCIDLTQSRPHDPSIKASKRKGNLYVRLNHATKLTDKDLFGKSDPFIEMWLDKSYKQRSKDTKGLNPTFNETFCFYVRPGQDKLYVKAVDKDTFSNDKIGDATIPLSTVFQMGTDGPRDYQLPKWLGLSSNGAVNMQMQYQEDYST